MNSYEQRLARTVNAIEMKPVDKIPFSYSGAAYVAKERGVLMKDFLSDYALASDTSADFTLAHPGIDTIQSPIFCPQALTMLWLSAVRSPGGELPDDELWQVDEREVIKFEDYQEIIKIGYGPWVAKLLTERLGNPLSKLAAFAQYGPVAQQRLKDAGVPVINGAILATPFEGFCGGRTLMSFFIDLMEEPELVKKAYDCAWDYLLKGYIATLEATKPIGAWCGGWRIAPDMLSHDLWMEFVWPYFKEGILATIERGVIPILHMDSKWDREFGMLLELPARKCVVMLDGASDMRLARKTLGDHSCLMGDVPSTLLAFGTADDVFNYTTRLIDDCGPKTGLIVSSGCDCPLNAKPQNVAAMIEATEAYRV